MEGETEEEAKSALRSEGFEVAAETEESSEGEAGEVVDQDPSGGSDAEEGSEVTITVGEGPSTVTVPDLAGKTSPRRAAHCIEAVI